MAPVFSKNVRWVLVFSLIFVFWSIYRYLFQFPEWVDEFIAKPVLQVVPVLLMVFFLEKKSVGSLGLSGVKLPMQIAVGMGVGLLLFTEAFIMQMVKGRVQTVLAESLVLQFFISLATGFTEELVFRGYLTSRIMETIENIYVANAIQTVLFIAIHIPLMIFLFHYSAAGMIAYSIQIGILGYVYGIVYIKMESIVPTIIAHTIWNFSNILFR